VARDVGRSPYNWSSADSTLVTALNLGKFSIFLSVGLAVDAVAIFDVHLKGISDFGRVGFADFANVICGIVGPFEVSFLSLGTNSFLDKYRFCLKHGLCDHRFRRRKHWSLFDGQFVSSNRGLFDFYNFAAATISRRVVTSAFNMP